MPSKSTIDDEEFTPSGDWNNSDSGDDNDDILDLSDVKEFQFEALSPGVYESDVESVEYGNSQRSGNPMLTWTFNVPVEGDDGTTRKRKMFFHTTLLPDQMARVKKTILAIKPDYDVSRVNVKTLGDDLTGEPCRVRLKVETYEGQRRNRVTDVLPAPAEARFLSD